MNNLSRILLWGGITIILSLIILIFLPFFEGKIGKAKAELNSQIFNFSNPEKLVIFQENTLFPLSNPINPEPENIQKMKVIITAYSSTPWETDDNPYLTAAGTQVREGIVANNLFPFGTKIRIPELFGDKIFVVEDRMHWKKDNEHIDIWFPDYEKALNFGVKITYIEILGK